MFLCGKKESRNQSICVDFIGIYEPYFEGCVFLFLVQQNESECRYYEISRWLHCGLFSSRSFVGDNDYGKHSFYTLNQVLSHVVVAPQLELITWVLFLTCSLTFLHYKKGFSRWTMYSTWWSLWIGLIFAPVASLEGLTDPPLGALRSCDQRSNPLANQICAPESPLRLSGYLPNKVTSESNHYKLLKIAIVKSNPLLNRRCSSPEVCCLKEQLITNRQQLSYLNMP